MYVCVCRSIGLSLDDGSASSAPVAAAAASARRCKLITMEWVAEQRRLQTEALMHGDDGAAPAAAAAPAMED